MKAKKIVPENSEQPKPLLAPLDEFLKERGRLFPFERDSITLGETRITNASGPFDAIDHLLSRAVAACEIVEEMALSDSPNECPKEHLGGVMEIILEDIRVVQWLVRRMA